MPEVGSNTTGCGDSKGAFLAPVDGELSPETFVPCVKGLASTWVVEFHSHMCGTCQAFQPRWRELVDLLQHEGPRSWRLGKIDIDRGKGLKLAEKEGVMEGGVPSIFLYLGQGISGLRVDFDTEADEFPSA